MFSGAIARLRAEAEKTTKTNAELLAEWSCSDFNKVVAVESGRTIQDRGTVAGAALAGSGVLGVLGLVGTGATSITAIAASMSIGAVCTAALPVAAIVALGAVVTGSVVMWLSQARDIDVGKGFDAAHERDAALKYGASVNGDGHDGKIGLKNWVKGAKSLVGCLLREQFAGAQVDRSQVARVQGELNGSDAYDDIVNKAADSLKAKGVVGVVRDANQNSGSYVGTVVAKNDEFVAVDIGKNHFVVMPNAISIAQFEVGKMIDVKFKNGVGQGVSWGAGKAVGLER